MFENMLGHQNIKILLNTDYKEIIETIPFKKMIYTGPVDEYFDFRYGKLPYRSLRFEFETHDKPVYQPGPVINYPNDYAYTRVTEFKYLTGQESNKTTVVYEYPQDEGDPYYPVPRQENADLYKRYAVLADETPDVYFAGRLATYKYYNMDQVVAQALTLFGKIAEHDTEIALPMATTVSSGSRLTDVDGVAFRPQAIARNGNGHNGRRRQNGSGKARSQNAKTDGKGNGDPARYVKPTS